MDRTPKIFYGGSHSTGRPKSIPNPRNVQIRYSNMHVSATYKTVVALAAIKLLFYPLSSYNQSYGPGDGMNKFASTLDNSDVSFLCLVASVLVHFSYCVYY